jgi:glycosyltransferase involved in cell wall biosynthesis
MAASNNNVDYPSDQRVAVNARFHVHKKTGMQRYAHEVSSRLSSHLREIRPKGSLRGPVGHLWEQFVLPVAVGKNLLWSPNNTGPISVRRQVCTIHDLIPLDRPEWFSRSFVSWYRWMLPALARSVQHLIAISEYTKSRVVDIFGVSAEKVTVVLNGVGQEFSPRPSPEVTAMRTKLGISDQPYLLYVGSLEPRKNLSRLLQAWARVCEACPDTQLIVTGLSMKGSRVFSEVQLELIPPRVFFTGYVSAEDLPSLYSGAEAFIYPSLYEGFGLPPAEAMACGTPVITSLGTSLPEVVGDDAVLVDPHNVDSIAAGILEVVRNESLRRQLSVRGLERVKRFSWESSAIETWKVLEREAELA